MNEIITGPGDYKCRDGKKATVAFSPPDSGMWYGHRQTARVYGWPPNGRAYANTDDDYDIISPWTEPKLRPWTHAEVSLDALFRHKNCNGWSKILGRIANGSYQLCESVTNETPDLAWLFLHYEHSTDGGKTWRPCGVVE